MERSWAASGDTVTDEFAGWKSAIPDHWDLEDPKADVASALWLDTNLASHVYYKTDGRWRRYR